MSDATPVASSATPDPTPAPLVTAKERAHLDGDQRAYKAARLAERAGKPLDPVPADQTADAASAKPAEQAASTDATPKPASEPGKPTGHKGDAESRKSELEAEIQGLLKQRAELRREVQAPKPQAQTPQADPSPAPANAKALEYPADLRSFDAYMSAHPDATYEDFTDARADHRFTHRLAERDAEARQKAEREEKARTVAERAEAFQKRYQERKAADPDIDKQINRDVLAALKPLDVLDTPEQATRHNMIGQQIYESEHSVDLLLHFSEHPEDIERVERLHSPMAMAYELGVIAGKRQAPTAPSVPPTKTITDAPPPPVALGNRPSDPSDPLDAAHAANDQRAYKAARMRRRAGHLNGR